MKIKYGLFFYLFLIICIHASSQEDKFDTLQPINEISAFRAEFLVDGLQGKEVNFFIPPGKDFESVQLKGFSIGESYIKSRFLSAQFVDTVVTHNIRNQEIVQVLVDPVIDLPNGKRVKVTSLDLEIKLQQSASNDSKYLKSIHWRKNLSNLVVNPEMIPGEIERCAGQREEGAEYVIICPDMFAPAIDELRLWRLCEGVETKVFTTSEIGTTVNEIEAFIDNAYFSWNIPPGAVLLAGDQELIPAPVWESYCLSDNKYADVDGDGLPEMIISRLPISSVDELEMYFERLFEFETNPPADPSYYNYPLAATSFENHYSPSWMVAEIFNGWYQNEMQKEPVRVYAGDTAPAEWPDQDLYSMFGPDGLNYIPETPGYLGSYGGGNAHLMNEVLNAGSMTWFGYTNGSTSGWGSPSYQVSDLQGLDDALPSFQISMSGLTGDFGSEEPCFAEAYLLHQFGGLGTVAPSELLYANASPLFTIGLLDGLWNDFLPGFTKRFLPYNVFLSQANVSAKLFLEMYPSAINPNIKSSYFHTFHHFGAPFVPLFDSVPRDIEITHSDNIIPDQTVFEVQAEDGAVVSLMLNGHVNAVMMSSGNGMILPLFNPQEGDTLHVTATKHNHKRYHALVACSQSNHLQHVFKNVFSVAPNPASDEVVVKFPGDFPEILSIELVDLPGMKYLVRSMEEIHNGGEIVVDLSGKAHGTYILQVETLSGMYVEKILILP